jgi:hypothetical protein
MADIPAHDPAGPQSDPADESVAMLAGVPTEAHGTTAVMDPAPQQPPGEDLPVWSFSEKPPMRDALAPVDRNQVELPFAAPPTLSAPPEVRSRPLFGPVGAHRSALVVALLSVVTLGVYALVWHHRINRELEEFDPKMYSRPTRSTVAVAAPWLAGLVVTLAGAALIVGARLSLNLPFATHVTTTQAYYLLGGLLAVPYLTLLLPFSVVAVVMTLERLRCAEEHVGTTTDRQVRAVAASALLALPVIGGLLLVGMTQRRVNAVWDGVAPTGHLSH